MDYFALKEADAVLGISDPEQAAAALNAQTVTLPPQNIPADLIRNILRRPLEWPRILLVARMALSGAVPPTATDQLVTACVAAADLADSSTLIQTSDESVWATFLSGIQAFLAAGLIGQASHDAIVALRTPTVPAWPKIIIADDVVAARTIQGA